MSVKQLLAREKQAKRGQRAERRSRRILRLPDVEQKTGYKHAAIYEGIARGTFPAPIPLGARAVGWLEDEIDAWIDARVAERDSGAVVRSLPLAGIKPLRKHQTPAESTATRATEREAEPAG